jgi:hypothetical protein
MDVLLYVLRNSGRRKQYIQLCLDQSGQLILLRHFLDTFNHNLFSYKILLPNVRRI